MPVSWRPKRAKTDVPFSWLLGSLLRGLGDMVCINNIIAVCSTLGVYNQEGFIIKRTAIPMTLYGIIAGIIGIVLSIL